MNRLDRAIAWAAPSWGMKRAAARKVIQHLDKQSQRYVGKPGDWDRNTGNRTQYTQ
jgi:hypothetical protein